MTQPEFKTFWNVAGERYFNIDDVAKLVEAGHVAVEVPASKQAEDWQQQQLLDQWHRQALERYQKFAAEAAHRNSPEGRAETARREAALHGGSRVTLAGPKNDAFAELDQYGPHKTDVFK